MHFRSPVALPHCSVVFLRSAWAAAAIDPGFRTADTVNVNIVNEERRASILEIVRTEPSVASFSASWPGLLGGRPALANGGTGKSSARYQLVTPEYFDVLGIRILRGRGFMPTSGSTGAQCGRSKRAASCGRHAALGQVLRLGRSKNDRAPGRSATLSRTSSSRIAPDVAGWVGGEEGGPEFM